MRVLVYLLALGMMLATPAWAQLEVGQNTSLTLSGDLGFGYEGITATKKAPVIAQP